ncbi:MAG: DNA topoisomerase (ATP-hydrolyzing) subunit B [Bdellovibrio sp.]
MAIENVKRKGKAVDAVIESKDQRWHCRNRITLVFGSNDIEDLETYLYTENGIKFTTVKFHQAKSKAIEEILDNCIDEYYRGHVTEIHTILHDDKKTVTITDNGIGFPLDKIKQVYTEFRTGSKFKDEDVDEKGFLYRTLGQNGLGASATCLTSDVFKATVRHYNTKKEQTYTFIDGALKINKNQPKPFKGSSGVTIELMLAKEVYKDNTIDEELLRKRIIDLAYNNPGLTFHFNNEKYHFKKGLLELAERINKESAQLICEDHYDFETQTAKGKKAKGRIDMHLSLAIDFKSEDRERFISFVNSTPTFDGGFHQDRVRRIFINAVKDKIEREVRKQKITVIDNDILTGITFVLGIVMPNPRFESQTKRKLVRDQNLEKGIEQFMEKNMDKFLRKNKEYLELVVARASTRHRFQELKDASKVTKKLKKQRVEKLLDANERRDRSKCTLFICEGDSAIGGLRSARDKMYQGGIALKGKPLNVSQATVKDVIENSEFADIMGSIGLMLGEPVDVEKLFYSKVVFLSDSDVDGGHINTLLTNFFYTFWPELFERKMIQVAKAPLFEVVTDKDTIFVESPGELEEVKKRKDIKIKSIHRNKGLGEMSPEAWKHVMSRENYTVITAGDAENAKKMLDICFGKDTNLRKDLLLDPDSFEMNPVGGKKSEGEELSVKAKKKERATKAKPALKKKSPSKSKTVNA